MRDNHIVNGKRVGELSQIYTITVNIVVFRHVSFIFNCCKSRFRLANWEKCVFEVGNIEKLDGSKA